MNTETSVTAGISISLTDTGSASLTIKHKDTERPLALEDSSENRDQPLSRLRYSGELFLAGFAENVQRHTLYPQKPSSTSDCNYRKCVATALKLDLLFEMTVWVQSCKAGRGIQTEPQWCSVSSLFVSPLFLCSISVR